MLGWNALLPRPKVAHVALLLLEVSGFSVLFAWLLGLGSYCVYGTSCRGCSSALSLWPLTMGFLIRARQYAMIFLGLLESWVSPFASLFPLMAVRYSFGSRGRPLLFVTSLPSLSGFGFGTCKVFA